MAGVPAAAKPVYRFGAFELRPDSGELFRNGERVRLPQQSVQVLMALLEDPGAVVTRDQLRQRLWPKGTFVDFEHSLNAAVKRLRAALEDDADHPQYVETLPKRGYRLVTGAALETPGANQTAKGMDVRLERDRQLPRLPRLAFAGLAGAAMLILIGWGTLSIFYMRAKNGDPAPPRNGQAYELYLRSLAYKLEYPANTQAIELLERSTALDGGSARSWYELARRYEIEFANAARGRGYFEQAREANRRALELAPEFAPVRMQQALLEIEGGQVMAGYQAALALVKSRPQEAHGHYALSAAFRHAGMLEEAARECDVASRLDPANTAWRSCALVFVLLGKTEGAQAFINLDPLSSYARFRSMEVGILTNRRAAALQAIRSVRVGEHDYADAHMLEAVLSGAPPEVVQRWSREAEALYDRISLAEAYYVDARYQAWAGQKEAALRLLRRAIANSYCAYPEMDTDPFLANIRGLPDFQEMRLAGRSCSTRYRALMQQP